MYKIARQATTTTTSQRETEKKRKSFRNGFLSHSLQSSPQMDRKKKNCFLTIYLFKAKVDVVVNSTPTNTHQPCIRCCVHTQSGTRWTLRATNQQITWMWKQEKSINGTVSMWNGMEWNEYSRVDCRAWAKTIKFNKYKCATFIRL